MKNKLGYVLACIVATTMLFGCGNVGKTTEVATSPQAVNGEELNVIATVFAPYDFARQVVGDLGEVTMLLPPAAESHSYEPTPQDIIKIQECDVFIYTGGESDEWVTDVLASIGNEDIQVIKMVDVVDAVEEELVEGMQAHEHEHSEEAHEGEDEHEHEHSEEAHEEEHKHEHEHSEGEVEYDEHVWTSPKNAIKIVEAIEDAVSEADMTNSEAYKANTMNYVAELEALDKTFQEVVDGAVRKEVVFADRFPLRYFVEEYGLEYYAAFPGCSTDTEPSAATVAFLIDKVKEDQIPVVFHIELSNEKMADTICEATGAKKLLFNACHNLSKEEFENGMTYVEAMQGNVEVLKEALY